jgi:hypothetical protein
MDMIKTGTSHLFFIQSTLLSALQSTQHLRPLYQKNGTSPMLSQNFQGNSIKGRVEKAEEKQDKR